MKSNMSQRINWTLGGIVIGVVALGGLVVFDTPIGSKMQNKGLEIKLNNGVNQESASNNSKGDNANKDQTASQEVGDNTVNTIIPTSLNLNDLIIKSNEIFDNAQKENDPYLKEKMYLEVTQVCNDILKISPENIGIIKRIMYSYLALGQLESERKEKYVNYEKAKDLAYQAITINSSSTDLSNLQYYYAQCVYNMGITADTDKSVELLEESLGYFENLVTYEEYSNNYVVMISRLLYDKTNDIKYLEVEFDKLLKINLNNNTVDNYEILKELSDIYYILGFSTKGNLEDSNLYLKKSMNYIDKALILKNDEYLLSQRKKVTDLLNVED